MNKSTGLTKAGQYEIRVKGAVDTRWQSWFEGMTITPGDELRFGKLAFSLQAA